MKYLQRIFRDDPRDLREREFLPLISQISADKLEVIDTEISAMIRAICGKDLEVIDTGYRPGFQ